MTASTSTHKPTTTELVAAVREHATANYEGGGWDVVVEAWDDEQIVEAIGRSRTAKGAIAKVAEIVGTYADVRAEAIAAGGEEQAEAPAETLGLPKGTLEFFRALADDAGNWGGNPWFDGNVAAGRSASGYVTRLVKAGLIESHSDEGHAFAIFTPAGIEAAGKLGIDLTYITHPAPAKAATEAPAEAAKGTAPAPSKPTAAKAAPAGVQVVAGTLAPELAVYAGPAARKHKGLVLAISPAAYPELVDGTLRCLGACGEEKPATRFPYTAEKGTGKGRYVECGACQVARLKANKERAAGTEATPRPRATVIAKAAE